MSAINDLMTALVTNSDLQKSMTNAATPEEAVKAAADAGFNVTSNELLEAYKSKMGEMSEEELASVAGGKGDSYQNNYGSHGNHADGGDGSGTHTGVSGGQ